MKKTIFLALSMALIFIVGCGKSTSSDEQVALDYINQYLNGTVEERQKFVSSKVHQDVKAIFELGASFVADEDKKFLNPSVSKSTKYESEGTKGSLVLLTNDSEHEVIALIMEGKLGWVFNSDDKEAFDEMKNQFK